MADFQTQVEALTGLTETTRLSQYLKDGVIDVQNKVIALKPEDKFHFQRVTSELTSNDSETVKGEILSVVRESGTNNDWREARAIAPSLQSRVTDISSIHYASKFNPAYTLLDNGKINVFPVPGSNPDAFKVYYITTDPKRDSDATDIAFGDSDIRFFPKDKVYLVVLYASAKVIDYYVKAAHDNLPSDISVIVLEEPTQSLPSYTGPGAFIQPAPPADADVDYSDVSSIVTFTPPIYSQDELPTIPDMTLPIAPTAPAIALNSGSLTGTAPVYNQPLVTLTADISIDSFSISATAPTAPSLVANSLNFNFTAPTYTAPVLSLESKPDISDLTISDTPPSVPVVIENSLDFTAAAPTFVPPITSLDFADANTWIADEDSEMSRARVEVINSQLQKYNTDIQNNLNKFNEENAQYQVEFQDAVQNLAHKDNKTKNELSKYTGEIQSYAQSVSTQIQQFTQNFQKNLQFWQNNRSTEIQKYQIDVQNSLNDFNKENAAYQIEFNKALQNAQLGNQDDQQAISKYQQELASYASDINKAVQEYQVENSLSIQLFQAKRTTEIQKYSADVQNEVNKFNEASTVYQSQTQVDMQDAQLKDTKQERDIKVYTQELAKYQASINAEVQRWQAEDFTKVFNEWREKLAASVQEYNADIQKETSRVAASLQDHQAKVAKALQKYQAETGYDMSKYQAQVQSESAKFQSDLTLNSTEFQNNIGAYTAEFQRVSALNQNKITKYGAEVQNYANQVAKVKMDVDLYQQRAMKLEKQYTEAFLVMAPRQQQGER